MNKNLEQEYRELMAEDMPDLWDRIEAGLEPKQPVEVRREQSGSRGGQSRRRRYGAWGIAAAACLCLAVVGLGTAYQNRLGGMSGFTDGGENAAWENNSPQMGETEWAGEAMNGGIYDLSQGEEYTAMDTERPQEPAAALLEVRVRKAGGCRRGGVHGAGGGSGRGGAFGGRYHQNLRQRYPGGGTGRTEVLSDGIVCPPVWRRGSRLFCCDSTAFGK